MADKQGLNVVIEGSEGVGKSTLVTRLGDSIPDLVVARHPGATLFGKEIRELIKFNEQINLSPYIEQVALAADYCDFIDKILIPNTKKGITVLSDRSNLVSGMIYALAGGVAINRIKLFQDVSLMMSPPKMHVIILYANREALMSRRKMDDKFENLGNDFHDKVCNNYRLLAENAGKVRLHCGSMLFDSNFLLGDKFMFTRCLEFVTTIGPRFSIHGIDAMKTQDEVFDEAMMILRSLTSSSA